MNIFRILMIMACLVYNSVEAHAASKLETAIRDMEALNQGSDDSIQGLYKAVLKHEGTGFYQYAKITLRTINSGTGELKISANVRIYFGDWDSNEYLTYEFSDCPINIITRQISMKSETNEVSFIGILRNGSLDGEWHSTVIGRAGEFNASKTAEPVTPPDGKLVKSLTGHYRGTLTNTNPQSNLPEKITFSFVSSQNTTGPDAGIKISGNTRMYLGDFDSMEYVEDPFSSAQFNFYNRYLTARTTKYGLTFKGTMNHDGTFKGSMFSDGLGEIGKVDLKRFP